MADKKPEAQAEAPAPITLVAVKRGFAMGRMIEPGTSFLFAPLDRNGVARKLPKWAVLPADVPKAKPAEMPFDTKPADARAAAKKKAVLIASGS
jgi:hypothetical protein